MSGSRTLIWCPSSAQQKIISRCGPNARHVVKRSSHTFVRYRNYVEMGREAIFRVSLLWAYQKTGFAKSSARDGVTRIGPQGQSV